MGQKSIPVPIIATVITVFVLLIGFFLYKGVTGGTVGDGEPGKVEAAPPMPSSAHQQRLQDAQRQGGRSAPP